MKVTDEMVEAADKAFMKIIFATSYPVSKECMRAALEAALGQFMLQCGDNIELQEAEQIGFKRSCACIEDLAEALHYMIHTQETWEEDVSKIIQRPANIFNRAIDTARATLERWGLR